MAAKSILAEYYNKGAVDVKHKDPKQEFSSIPDDTVVVKVKRGSKVKNIMGFVEKTLKEGTNRHIIFTGCGDAIEKTITCTEITKSKFQGLHQISKLNTLRVEEFWDPKDPEIDRLQVTREVPMICVLLCKDSLDSNELGYQGPKPSKRNSSGIHKRKNTEDHAPIEDKGRKETSCRSHLLALHTNQRVIATGLQDAVKNTFSCVIKDEKRN